MLGHVSVRLDDDTVLVRARGPQECGVLLHGARRRRRLLAAHRRACWPRPTARCRTSCRSTSPATATTTSIGAVVHAHPPAVVAADLAGVPLVPLVGAYNIPAARLAADGIGVFPRAVLIDTDDLGAEMRAAMAGRPVCVLRGHGITATGATLEQAVARALAVDSLARMTSRVAALGATPRRDRRRRPRPAARPRHRRSTTTMVWRHHERRLAEAGLALAVTEEARR